MTTTLRFAVIAVVLSFAMGALAASCSDFGANPAPGDPADGGGSEAAAASDGTTGDDSAAAVEASLPPADAGLCVPVPAGLVSWFTGDKTSTNADGLGDTGPGGNDLLFDGVTANASLAPGRVGNAFLLGAGAGLHRPQPTAAIDALTPLTIEAWIQPAKPGGELVTRFTNALGGWIFRQVLVAPDGATPYSILQFRVGNGDAGALGTVSGTGHVEVGVWSHVAVVYDGISASLFLNGNLDNSVNTNLSSGNPPEMRIGGLAGNAYTFQGLVDEVSIYKAALTKAEIAAIHAAGSAGKCH
jgi:hypothetical protein